MIDPDDQVLSEGQARFLERQPARSGNVVQLHAELDALLDPLRQVRDRNGDELIMPCRQIGLFELAVQILDRLGRSRRRGDQEILHLG